jgi:two-component system NtrC family response regulator
MTKTQEQLRILLAEDDASLSRVVQFKLEHRGYSVTTAKNGVEALDLIRRRNYDLLLTDVRMPEMDGIELLSKAKELRPELYVVLITAHATVRQAVDAMKGGAFDYLTKPFDENELFSVVANVERFLRLELERKEFTTSREEFEVSLRLIGTSEALRRLMDVVAKVAQTDTTVLIMGESGTGKELVARSIHEQSRRRHRSFIGVNCAAIPKDLIESELFGHIKGAFTGADRDRKGRFELADGGTILLDEIGELAADIQVKLLRVLQEGEIDRVGGEGSQSVDVRVLAATNADLKAKVREGTFREDLFYRLSVIPLNVPNLRDRTSDIPLLVEEFLRRFTGGSLHYTDDFINVLQAYSWPGNIRELENLIERVVALRTNDTLTLEDIPEEMLETVNDASRNGMHIPSTDALIESGASLDDIQRHAIIEALEAEDWNQTRAAKRLSIPRHVLLYRMKKLSIEKRDGG